MKWFVLISVVALAGQMAARDGAGTDRADTSGGVVTLPSATGTSEAIPGVVVMLPAPPAPPIAAPKAEPPKVAEPIVPPIPPASDNRPPVLPRGARVYPAGFEDEIALFCQTKIGHWTEADAQALLGEPSRQRLALGEHQSETGLILAFCRSYRPLQGVGTGFLPPNRRFARRFCLSVENDVAGMPPPLGCPHHRPQGEPGTDLLFLPEPPAGCPGRSLRRRDQPGSVLIRP